MTKEELRGIACPPGGAQRDEVRVSFLGTGSANPSKYRNGSCILLQIPHRRGSSPSERQPQVGVLLDVAEGTVAQLYSLCDSSVLALDHLLLHLRVIWISHSHADHLCGVPALVEALYQARHRQRRRQAKSSGTKVGGEDEDEGDREQLQRKLTIFAPPGALEYFEFSLTAAGLEDLVSLVNINRTSFAGDRTLIRDASEGVVSSITSVPVQHCRHSFGAVLTIASAERRTDASPAPRDWKVVYSGDCRPSLPLVAAGIGCDLLIHEATFDSSMGEDAVRKRHCTTTEALQIAEHMRARHTILTHFSQRYPVLGGGSSKIRKATVAEDKDENDGVEEEEEEEEEEEVGVKRKGRDGPQRAEPPPAPYAVAFDFLSFSFPSQAQALPAATSSLSSLLRNWHSGGEAAGEEDDEEDEDEEGGNM